MEADRFKFVHPTRCLLSGPSGSGKSQFMQRVIRERENLFTVVPRVVLYTFKYPQAWFSEFPDVQFIKEVPSNLDPTTPSLVVIDDIVVDPEALKEAASLFVRGSHHLNASVFFITQNLFASSSHYRMVSLNANQFVLFKTLRGLHQIENLGRQIYNKQEIREFAKAYKNATSKPYTYLLVDLDPNQNYRLRTKIFSGEQEVVYLLE